MYENIYNFDKKVFMIGFDITSIWVISLEKMRIREIIRVTQDGNKE